MARGTVTAHRIGAQLADPKHRRRAVAEIAAALCKTGGNVVKAATELDVAHRTLMVWRKKFPAVEVAVQKARESATPS
jgi:transposase-like protein